MNRPFKNLKNLWKESRIRRLKKEEELQIRRLKEEEDLRIRQFEEGESRFKCLKKEIERMAWELTNGISPPYSKFTQEVLHEFNEAYSESKTEKDS